jgi:hypothetical protein
MSEVSSSLIVVIHRNAGVGTPPKNQCETSSCFVGETCGHSMRPKTCPSGCIVVRLKLPSTKPARLFFAYKNAGGGIGTLAQGQ